MSLQSHTHWRPHPSPTDNPNPIVSEMALVALSHKTKPKAVVFKRDGWSGLTDDQQRAVSPDSTHVKTGKEQHSRRKS